MDEPRKFIGGQTEPKDWELEVKGSDLREEVAPAYTSSGYGIEADDFAGGIRLRDYWRIIRKRLWLIVGLTLLITSLSAVYMAKQPDIYEAQSRIQVDLEGSASLGANSGNAAVLVSGSGSDPVYFNTQLQILTGPGLMRRVVKTLDLEHSKEFSAPLTGRRSTLDNLQRMFGLKTEDKESERKKPAREVPLTSAIANTTSQDDQVEAKRLAPFVNSMLMSLAVEPVRERRLPIKETRLIDVRYSHPDPAVAAKIVNAIADTYRLSNLERKTETNAATGNFLQERIVELQNQIREGAERLLAYGKQREILQLDSSQDTVVQRLTSLNGELLVAENARKLAQAALEARTTPGALSAMVAGASDVQALEGQLNQLKRRREELLIEATEEEPEVVNISQQIPVVEKQLAEVRQRNSTVMRTNLETEFRQARAREESLSAAYKKQRGETLTQNEAAINYRIIQQEIETYKTLLAGLLQQSKANEVMTAATGNNIHVVDYAVVPEAPVGPRRMRGVAMAFMLSLSFGVGLAFFLSYLDDGINTVEDVENIVRLPALAVIPAVGGTRTRQLLPASIHRSMLTRRNRKNTEAGEGHGRLELLFGAEPNSALAEAYKHLRTSMLLSSAGRPPKTLLITSGQQGEGKTTTSVNLAITLAQTGASVLLIDADMRRPRLQRIFGIEKEFGLSDILSSNMKTPEILDVVQSHAPTGVHVLTAGTPPPNPAELLGSDQMRRLLAISEASYTYTIIDSPPVAAFTDSILIASLVDGVFLVVQSARSSREVVRRTRKVLHDVGIKVFGVVLNNVKTAEQDGYYHYYGRNSY